MINYKNILIVRTDRIGDVVLTLPMAKFIKQNTPNANLTLLVNNYTQPVASSNKYIDKTMTLPVKNRSLNFSELIAEIKKEKFDAAIIVYPKFIISLALAFAGIKKRIGSGYRWFSFLFTDKVYEHRRTGQKHELEHNLNLLAPLGIKNTAAESVSFDIQPSRDSEQLINSLLEKQGINSSKKLIIVHPGSGGSSIDLPIAKFIELSKNLAYELECNIAVTGTESEKSICNEFIIAENIFNFAGKFNLDELTALINRADLLIANSTGPIHIAAALNKFVVGFYPKIKECSVERWGPYTKNRLIFSPTINCTNCTRKQCEELNCMNSIEIDYVLKEIIKKLN